MMIEPLYCTQCGAEDFACECDPYAQGEGEYCDVCGRNDRSCDYCSETVDDDGFEL